MRKALLSATAAVTLTLAGMATSTSANAETQTVRKWYEDGVWQVWQSRFDSGQQACFMKAFHPTATGNATFGLSQNDTLDNGHLHYTEDGLTWTPGNLSLQIDGHAPWRANASTNEDKTMLTASLGAHPESFVMELRTGSVLRISTNNGVREFTLAGSTAATGALFNCLGAIKAQRQTVAPLPSDKPLVRPLPPTRYLGV
jgi:hypothetical protein